MADAIEHVVVLMMENRSFDHMLGAMPGVDGVNPQSPLVNSDHVNGGSYSQQPVAVDKLNPDPAHETSNVLRQVRVKAPHPSGPRDMGGFIADVVAQYPNAYAAWQQVMAYFPLGHLPAMHKLAQAFCTCDRWFSSVPGPTWTNRFFAHSGTSQGWVEMPHRSPPDFNFHRYDQVTLYDRLNERRVPWRIYVGDIAQSFVLRRMRDSHNARGYRRWSNFHDDVGSSDGTSFPAYVFIEPTYFIRGQNDQHPPHDILKGDQLIAEVYNALRANSALWENTLLIVTYDEHGGFCDHVPPPDAVNPDDKSQEGFDFTMYGVRVPTILASRWVKPSSVFRATQGQLDHTSILRYLSDKYQLGPLGKRTASAATIAEAIQTVPNDATPTHIGDQLRSAGRSELLLGPIDRFNPNQAALIDFSRWLEVEGGTAAETIGTREIRSRGNAEAESEMAVTRFWEYVARASA